MLAGTQKMGKTEGANLVLNVLMMMWMSYEILSDWMHGNTAPLSSILTSPASLSPLQSAFYQNIFRFLVNGP